MSTRALAALALALPAAAFGLGRQGTAQPSRGEVLYQQQCASCHRLDGTGQPRQGIPSLRGVGAASVDFYLSTGRMPAAQIVAQAPRHPVTVSAADRAAIVGYVASSWPGGPDIPQFSLKGRRPTGGELFRSNCAACHGAVGAGAALAYGSYAPSLHHDNPRQVAEAIRVGPGNMPVFDPSNLSDGEVADIVTYVQYLRHPDDHGGAGLGHVGPIAEGFVGLVIGLLGAVVVATWVGERQEASPRRRIR